MVSRDFIVQGLLQRGLPPHVAQGFAMNMQDESGLRPGVNEVAPLVPGSRGGFGLYQVTGPRRRAYEEFARSRGANLDDPDAQLDFLMTELQGPEARASRSIMATDNPRDAAVAIARDFLRPAPENLQKRVARYSGETPMAPQGLLGGPTVSTRGPQEETPFVKTPGFANILDTLAMGFQGMTLNPNQALMQQSARRIEGRQQAAQTKAQRNRTAEWLRSQGRDDLAQAVMSGSISGRDAVAMMMQQPADDRTALQKNYEFFISQGMSPQEAMQAVRSGTTVNVGDQGPPMGTIPPGMMVVQDPEAPGGRRMVPISGSPAAIEQQEAAEKETRAETQQGQQEAIITRSVDNLIKMIDSGGAFDLPESGIVGNLLGQAGVNQEAVNFRNELASVQANIAFDRLQRMRDASKTGGALGAVSERELTLLMNAYGNIDQSTDPQLLRENLLTIKNIMTKIENDPVARQAYYGGNVGAAGASSGGFSVTGQVD